MSEQEKEISGITIPTEVLQLFNLTGEITVKARPCICILSKAQMNAIEVIQVIQSLQDTLEELHLVLRDQFYEGESCEECSCCEQIVEDSVFVPTWAKELIGVSEDTRFCIVVPEGEGRIILEPVDYKHNISDVSKEMRDQLRAEGICLEHLNESIMEGDTIYEV